MASLVPHEIHRTLNVKPEREKIQPSQPSRHLALQWQVELNLKLLRNALPLQVLFTTTMDLPFLSCSLDHLNRTRTDTIGIWLEDVRVC